MPGRGMNYCETGADHGHFKVGLAQHVWFCAYMLRKASLRLFPGMQATPGRLVTAHRPRNGDRLRGPPDEDATPTISLRQHSGVVLCRDVSGRMLTGLEISVVCMPESERAPQRKDAVAGQKM